MSQNPNIAKAPIALQGTTPAVAHASEKPGQLHTLPGDERLASLQDATVMMVDDDEPTTGMLQIFLEEAGYRDIVVANDSRDALGLIQERRPDVILLDLVMPNVTGFDILREMRSSGLLKLIPVIVLTSASSPDTKLEALNLGANDLLAKPVDSSELSLRLRNTLAAKAYQDHLSNYSKVLEEQVRLRTIELEAAQQQIVHCLARAAEFRDDDTGQHVIRVGRYAAVIARTLGCPPDMIELIEQAAQLHDVGKIGIPDNVLLKPGRLKPEEFDIIKAHCEIGEGIAQPLTQDDWERLVRHTLIGADIMGVPHAPVMQMAAIIAATHHEKWDGNGYPRGLKGEQIPLEGRITAVADVYDALSSRRPYKEPFPTEKCFKIMTEGKGSHFDPGVLEAFFSVADEIFEIQAKLMD